MNDFERHGGPWDRGGADAYYGRAFNPHYFVGDTYSSEMVKRENMSSEQIQAYTLSYNTTYERKSWD